MRVCPDQRGLGRSGRKACQAPHLQGARRQPLFHTYKSDVTADKQGRIQLPIALRRIAEIEGNAVIVGNGNRVEIWNPDRFAAMEQALDTDSIVAAMDELDF